MIFVYVFEAVMNLCLVNPLLCYR